LSGFPASQSSIEKTKTSKNKAKGERATDLQRRLDTIQKIDLHRNRLFFIGAPLHEALERDREWSVGMMIMCVIGVAFFVLGMFGSRRLVDAADIVP
jgi:hypothetical protein